MEKWILQIKDPTTRGRTRDLGEEINAYLKSLGNKTSKLNLIDYEGTIIISGVPETIISLICEKFSTEKYEISHITSEGSLNLSRRVKGERELRQKILDLGCLVEELKMEQDNLFRKNGVLEKEKDHLSEKLTKIEEHLGYFVMGFEFLKNLANGDVPGLKMPQEGQKSEDISDRLNGETYSSSEAIGLWKKNVQEEHGLERPPSFYKTILYNYIQRGAITVSRNEAGKLRIDKKSFHQLLSDYRPRIGKKPENKPEETGYYTKKQVCELLGFGDGMPLIWLGRHEFIRHLGKGLYDKESVDNHIMTKKETKVFSKTGVPPFFYP